MSAIDPIDPVDPIDPIDQVRDAWDELPTPELEHDDATDRAVDAWMNAAWSTLRVPAARPRSRWQPSYVGAFAAAALVTVAAFLALRTESAAIEPIETPTMAPMAIAHTFAVDPRGRFHLALEHAAPALAATSSAVFTALAAPEALSRDARVGTDTDSLVDQAFASNRAGRYREAAAFATLALDGDETQPEARCAALVNWIHAEHALGHVDEADRLSDRLTVALSR